MVGSIWHPHDNNTLWNSVKRRIEVAENLMMVLIHELQKMV